MIITSFNLDTRSLIGIFFIKDTYALDISGQMKQGRLFCTATAVDSLVLLHCSIQHRLPHCLVRSYLSEHTCIYLVMHSSLLTCTCKKAHDHHKAGTQGVVSVFRSRMLEIHTTRSWDFMGLRLHMQMEQPSQRHLKFGDDVIVGVLDTGIYSFPCIAANPVFAGFYFPIETRNHFFSCTLLITTWKKWFPNIHPESCWR